MLGGGLAALCHVLHMNLFALYCFIFQFIYCVWLL